MSEPYDHASEPDDPNGVKETLSGLRRTMRLLVASTVILYLVVVGITVLNRIDASNNRDAICAVRDDQLKRIEQTQDFLKENPQGVGGIPREALLQTIDNARATADSLSAANCPDGSVGDAAKTAQKITRVEIQALAAPTRP